MFKKTGMEEHLGSALQGSILTIILIVLFINSKTDVKNIVLNIKTIHTQT